MYNLSASATRDNLSLIAVVLRAPTPKVRFAEAKLLLDYGFSTYDFKKIATKGDVLQSVNIEKGIESSVNLVFENDSGVLIKKSNSSEIKQEVVLKENIETPISKNEILGTMNYYIEDKLISSINLVAEKEISKKNVFNMFNFIGENWLNLLRN